MNAMEETRERAKMGPEDSASSSKRLIMTNKTIALLIALQFLWFFILGGVFYGYIDSQESINSIKVKLEQTEKKLTSLTAHMNSVEDAMKTANRVPLRGSSAAVEINAPALPPLKEIPKSITTVNQLTHQGSSHEAAIKASPVYPARKMLRHSEQFHEVNHGETLYTISKHYGISVETILRLNNLQQDQPILSGQKLLIAPARR
jgi:LysM repeat protein